MRYVMIDAMEKHEAGAGERDCGQGIAVLHGWGRWRPETWRGSACWTNISLHLTWIS